MADMPHVGYFEANTVYTAGELCILRNCKLQSLLIWLNRNDIPVLPGPSFPENVLDFTVAGRHIVLVGERNAVPVSELFKNTQLEVLLND